MSNQPAPPQLQTRLPLLLALTLAAGMFIGQQLPKAGAHLRRSSHAAAGTESVLDEIMRYVQARYVDTVNVEAIKTGAIKSLLDQLDPHSIYISPEEAKAAEEDMSGGFEGIGIEFIMLDDTIQVITPLQGGPSETAGILAGDKIVRINDTVVAGVQIDNNAIYKKLRGAKGSTVKLDIQRGRETALRAFNVVRDRIPVHSVETSYMLDEKTGYIKINRFTSKTHSEFMEALRALVEEKAMTDLVLDLRGNPGGYLEEATQMLSQFFPEDKLLVYTQGRADIRQDYKSNGRARFTIRHIAILIDEGSASASEIMAGAIQDHDRGWVIGRRTFGKGLVQEEYPLSNKGKLRLTVARYYTPSGRSIQRDYKDGNAYNHEEERRLLAGELTDEHKIKIADSTKFYTGMGRIVYGGGGISPDIFIPLDTGYFSNLFNEMNQSLPAFLSRWMENHPRGTWPSNEAEFIRQYRVPTEMVRELALYAHRNGPLNEGELLRAQNEIKLRIKARLARLLFSVQAEFEVLNREDPAVEKALQVFKSGEPLVKR